jgi:hypothetical protein
VCKIAHWKANLKPVQVVIGHFWKFLTDSLVFLFLSKVSSIMEHREYIIHVFYILYVYMFLYIFSVFQTHKYIVSTKEVSCRHKH